ncbi:hypothetical protein ACFL01_02075 [Planctomycetota bacterium]
MTTHEAIERVCELARTYVDQGRVADAKRRHAAVLSWQDADYIPLQFYASVPELNELPSYDHKEQWYDPAKSFVCQMTNVVSGAASGSDWVPGVRADTGVINVPSVFGVEFDVPTHTKPVATKFVPKEELQEFIIPDDVSGLGTMPRVVEHMEHHLAVLAEHGLADTVGVHHCDLQGSFDIAEQARGSDIFTDVYDDPPFVHHLMEQSVRAYVAVGKLCKKVSGEPAAGGNASGYWMEGQGGLRACDDTGILLSAAVFEEFVQPYHVKAFEPFGAGWIHYCGGIPDGSRPEGIHLHDLYLANPLLRGMNFTTGGDLGAEIRKLHEKRVAFLGGVGREQGETLGDYFRRVLDLCPGRKGIVFDASVGGEEAESACETWHALQDDILG